MFIYVHLINVVVAQMFFYVTSSPALASLYFWGKGWESRNGWTHTDWREWQKVLHKNWSGCSHTSKSASKVCTETFTNECNSGWAARGLLRLTVSSFKHFQEYIFNLQTKPPSPPLKWIPIQSRHYPSSLRIGFKSPMRGINQNLASLFEEKTVICWFNNQQKLPEGKIVFLPGHLNA